MPGYTAAAARVKASDPSIGLVAGWKLPGQWQHDGTLTLWKPTQPTPLLTIPVGSAVESLCWSANGTQIAVASGLSVTLWNLHA